MIVVGGNGTVLRAPIPLPNPAWSSYDLALEPQNFILMNGAQPDTATFQAVLGQVEALFIMAEYGAAVQETTGLDEVRLWPACEPVTAPLVWAEMAGTPEAPLVRLAWAEVPGAWELRDPAAGWSLGPGDARGQHLFDAVGCAGGWPGRWPVPGTGPLQLRPAGRPGNT